MATDATDASDATDATEATEATEATGVATLDTPVGPLTLAASDAGLTHVMFRPLRRPVGATSAAAHAWLDLGCREIEAYVAGGLRRFTVPADLRRVSAAHARIHAALATVGYGETVTYGALAARLRLGADGPRVVGAAMARNPVAIVVPCHRVVGAGGKLVGYAGGLAAKRWLLDLEGRGRSPQLDLLT